MANRGRLRAAAFIALAFAAGAKRGYSQVQVSVAVRPAEAIFVSDLTPTGANAAADLFTVTLVKASSGTESVQLQLTVIRELPARAEVFSGTTNTFALAETARRISSNDLFSHGRDVSITDYSIAEDGNELRDQIAQTGRVPSGTYVFVVEVRRPLGVLLGRGEGRVRIGNPSRVLLLSPGTPLGVTPPTVNTTALRFIWSTDGAVAQSLYNLRVVRTDGAVSPEEAMQGRAAWETTTTASSELYPASAVAERLEPGASYAWQVTREVRTSGGVEVIQSPIYWFRAGGSGERTASATADDGFSLRLVELLKSLGLSDDVAGFRPVSARLSDGRTISLESLQEVLAAIGSGEIPLLSIRIR